MPGPRAGGNRATSAKPQSVPPTDNRTPAPELAAWLAANRETLIRRWLELVVERSTLDELGARPMAERVRELDLLLEAARSEGSALPGLPDPAIEEMLTAAIEQGGPVAVALIAPPGEPGPDSEAWTAALAQVAREEERVATTSDGLTVVALRADDAATAGIGADRLRAAAWQALGGTSRLPDAGVAVHPADGADAATLVAAARARLPGPAPAAEGAEGERNGDETGPPAFDDGVVRAARVLTEPHAGDEGRPAEVTPLYPESFD